jgi:hypothetical protein
MNDRITDFQQLIALTRAMLEKAQSSAWDEVIELEAKRRDLISAFFLTPIQTELAPTVAEGIQLIQAMDRDTAKLGLAEKLEAGQALQQMGQGRKAVKAYSF